MSALSPLTTYNRSITEAQMEQAIRDLVAGRGRVFHLRDAADQPWWRAAIVRQRRSLSAREVPDE